MRRRGYTRSLLFVALATALGWVFRRWLNLTDHAIVYLYVIIATALVFGRGPAFVATLGSVLAFDFFFVPPILEFNIADLHYIVTFMLLFLVGLLVTNLAERIHREEQALSEKERRTALLYDLSCALASTGAEGEALQTLVHHAGALFDNVAAAYQPNANGALQLVASHGEIAVAVSERAAIEAAWTQRECTGYGTGTLGHLHILCIPILDIHATLAVLVISASPQHAADQARFHLVQAMAQHTALCIARARAVYTTTAAEIRARTEENRNALLSAVSHDLRTPLAVITEAATMLRDDATLFTSEQRDEITRTICDQAERMERHVVNLLDMTRLATGSVTARRTWISCNELLYSALTLAQGNAAQLAITMAVPQELPLIHVDTMLLERLFANLLENAAKYAGTAAHIELTAYEDAGTLTVDVADNGPGLPPGSEERIFDKFYRAAQTHRTGTGLGLTICRAIIELHGGSIAAFNRATGGAVFRVRIPIDDAAPSAAA